MALLGVILALAAMLRLWAIADNGFGTEYYAASVRSMLHSGHLLLYGSFDPLGFVSIDKPPLAFWIQAGFAAVLGFHGWAIHLPQALAGTASVAILYFLVRRYFGVAAGMLAAASFAVTPIAIAIDRSNNTDSLLVLCLLLSARVALAGGGPALVGAMALLGLAFEVKMLAALVCGPALLAGWWLATALGWRARLGWLAASAAALVIVGLSWAVIFDLTPAKDRPYAGSSTSNSMLELIVVHNGLQRFVRDPPPALPPSALIERPELYDAVPVGPLRLAHPNLAGQFAWFLPLALLGAVLAWPRHRASAALWGLWALTYGLVYSAAGGIFHIYYLATLAPPLAALCGIGVATLYRGDRRLLAAALAATALWQALIVGSHLAWSSWWLLAPIFALAAALVVLVRKPVAMAGCAGALLVLPVAWSLSAILAPGNLMLPSASLARWQGGDDGRGPVLSGFVGQPAYDPHLAEFLIANRGTARFVIAAVSTRMMAPLIVHGDLPVMALGGFSGDDPILTLEAFKTMVERGELRFVLLPRAVSFAGRDVAQGRNQHIVRWIRVNGRVVDRKEWSSQALAATRGLVLYDLRRD